MASSSRPGDAETLARHLTTLAKDRDLRHHLGERPLSEGPGRISPWRAPWSGSSPSMRPFSAARAARQGRRDGALVCGAYGRGNAGDDAILEAIVTELRQMDPDLPVWVLSRNPDDTRLTYRVNSIYTFAFPRFLWRMRKTRLYINGGGSLMQDVTSHRSLWFYLFTISCGQAAGQPGDDVRLRHRPHSLPRQPPQGLPGAPEERGRHHPTGHPLHRRSWRTWG